MDFEWIFFRVLLIGGGYVLLGAIKEMSKDELQKKCGRFGYMLAKNTVTHSAAYWNCLFTIIWIPLVSTGFAAALAGYSGKYILETIIVALIVLMPPAIIPINKFLQEIKEDIEKEDKDY